MPDQLRLFPQPKITTGEIKRIVQEQLRDLPLRQKARDEKRKAANQSLRSEIGKLKRRMRF